MSDILFILVCVLPGLLAIALYLTIRGDEDMENGKKKRGKVLVVPPRPDTRTTCPRCKVVAERPLKSVTKKTLNGKVHRWGKYKCEAVTDGKACIQWFTRKLNDYD
jgi:hypothetical protein